ncbi:MAG: virulence factor [Chloroflexota bacterium]
MAVKYQIIYWRDMPAQVKVRVGRQRVSRPLSDRFEKAIDQAAMQSGAVGTDEYLAEWRNSEWQEREGDPEAIADELVTEIEAAYPRERLRDLAKQGGWENA